MAKHEETFFQVEEKEEDIVAVVVMVFHPLLLGHHLCLVVLHSQSSTALVVVYPQVTDFHDVHFPLEVEEEEEERMEGEEGNPWYLLKLMLLPHDLWLVPDPHFQLYV